MINKKIILTLLSCLCYVSISASNDSTLINLNDITITSFYQKGNSIGGNINATTLNKSNYGQEPSHLFIKMPSIISLNDNGTEFGYGYFRIRGLDQTRINVTIDGCPWNEAEDFGSYFANSPDLLSSMQSIKVERGSSSTYNGIAGVAGGILLESVDIYKGNQSHFDFMCGSFNSVKGTVVYNKTHKDNKWGLHIKATRQKTDGYRDFGFNESNALTIKTGYKFNPKHSVDILSMNGYHQNGQGWIGCTLDELKLNKHANGCNELEDDNWFMSMNRLQYKGWVSSNTLLTSSIYYQYQDGSYRFDLDNYMTKIVDKKWENTYSLYDYGLRHSMFGCNIVAKSYLDNLSLTYGLNTYKYQRKHFLDDKTINVHIDEYYNNIGTKKDFNTFITANYNLYKLSIFGNIQYRYAEFNYKDKINDLNSFNHNTFGTQWNFINYGIGCDYQINNLLLYSRFSKVNREPTRSDMFGGNENFIGELATITSESAHNVEFGCEYKPNNNINLGINLFYMWFNNELVLNGLYGANGLPCHENAQKSYRTGIEMVGDYKITKNIKIDGNISLTQNKVKTLTFGNKEHVLSPNVTSNLGITWNNNKLEIGCNANYHSKMYVDMDNIYTIPYLFTLNCFGKFNINDNLNITARFNNVTNRQNYNTGMIGVDNQMLYIQNALFNYNISLNYNF